MAKAKLINRKKQSTLSMRHQKGLSSKSSLPEINLKAMLTATSDFYHFLIFDRPLWIGKIYLQYY